MIRTVIDGTQGLTWVDVVEPTSAELTEIAHLYGLHPTSVRDSLDPEHLPKFERFPDRYFAIIRVFDVASSPDCATVHEMTRKVAIFAGPDFVVTIHRKAAAVPHQPAAAVAGGRRGRERRASRRTG